jgi:HlyD family secretion protein
MSTSVNPKPAQAEPQAVEPQPVQSPSRGFGGRKIQIAVILALVVLAAAAWFLRSRTRPAPGAAAPTVHTAVVRTGSLEQIIRIAGSTSAGIYANITAPILRGQEGNRGMTLVKLVPSGTMIKKDEILAQLDTTAAKDHIDDVEAMVRQAEADIRRAHANQDIREENLRQDVREAKAALDRAQIEHSALDVRTPIDQERLKLSLEESTAAYEEVQKDLETNLISQRAEIRYEEIDLERAKRHLGRHTYDLPNFDIRTPINGVAVMLSLRRGQGADMYQAQEGDQISPRQPFMKVVDPKSIEIIASVNQVASEEIRIGQPVVAHFDAFPGIALRGKIYSVGAIAGGVGRGGSSYVRWIPVRVKLLEQESRVIPDLSASADVLITRDENATLIPREAIFQEGGKSVVYVKASAGFTAREIQLGRMNYTQAAVSSGLRAGEEVALQRPPAVAAK